MAKAIRFKHTQVPRQPSERARLKVIKGPDAGAIYVLTEAKASIGRGDENDVVIADLRASRVHASLSLTPQGAILEDQASSNGILFQGGSVRRVALSNGTVFALGETTFEFMTAEAGTAMLMAPGKLQARAEEEHRSYRALQSTAGLNLDRSSSGSKGLDQEMAKPVFAVLLFLGVAFIIFYGDGTKKSTPSAQRTTAGSSSSLPAPTNLAAYLPSTQPSKTAEIIFKDGVREYFAGNYNRARTQFETVLQVRPNHPLAGMYLEKCTSAVKDEVKSQMSYGKKALDSGKLREARSHYDRVIRLLFKDQANPTYGEARDQYAKVMHQMKLDGGSGP